jgi:hypothetical protein
MLSVTTGLWGLATTYNHHLEGVTVYSIAGSLPMKSVSGTLVKTLDNKRGDKKKRYCTQPVCVA